MNSDLHNQSTRKHQWKEFLTDYNLALLAYLHDGGDNYNPQDITPEVIDSGWLGFPAATESQLRQLEARLKVSLPPSYRSFLLTSNGFHQPGQLVPRLFGANEVRPFDEGATWVGEPVSDEEYFVYGPEQLPETMRHEYLSTALVVSATEEAGTAMYLLNPQVVSETGEWEAWLMAHWLPGATRYRSFWELMQAEYAAFKDMMADLAMQISDKDQPDAVITKLPHLIRKIDEQIAFWQQVDSPIVPGTVEGFTVAKEQILIIRSRTRTPTQFRDALELLADELERRQLANAQKIMQDGIKTFVELLNKGLAAKLTMLHQQGMMEGYRQTAALIRWYLNDKHPS